MTTGIVSGAVDAICLMTHKYHYARYCRKRPRQQDPCGINEQAARDLGFGNKVSEGQHLPDFQFQTSENNTLQRMTSQTGRKCICIGFLDRGVPLTETQSASNALPTRIVQDLHVLAHQHFSSKAFARQPIVSI